MPRRHAPRIEREVDQPVAVVVLAIRTRRRLLVVALARIPRRRAPRVDRVVRQPILVVVDAVATLRDARRIDLVAVPPRAAPAVVREVDEPILVVVALVVARRRLQRVGLVEITLRRAPRIERIVHEPVLVVVRPIPARRLRPLRRILLVLVLGARAPQVVRIDEPVPVPIEPVAAPRRQPLDLHRQLERPALPERRVHEQEVIPRAHPLQVHAALAHHVPLLRAARQLAPGLQALPPRVEEQVLRGLLVVQREPQIRVELVAEHHDLLVRVTPTARPLERARTHRRVAQHELGVLRELHERHPLPTRIHLVGIRRRHAPRVEREVDQPVAVVVLVVRTRRQHLRIRLVAVLRLGAARIQRVVRAAILVVVLTVEARRQRDLLDHQRVPPPAPGRAVEEDVIIAGLRRLQHQPVAEHAVVDLLAGTRHLRRLAQARPPHVDRRLVLIALEVGPHHERLDRALHPVHERHLRRAHAPTRALRLERPRADLPPHHAVGVELDRIVDPPTAARLAPIRRRAAPAVVGVVDPVVAVVVPPIAARRRHRRIALVRVAHPRATGILRVVGVPIRVVVEPVAAPRRRHRRGLVVVTRRRAARVEREVGHAVRVVVLLVGALRRLGRILLARIRRAHAPGVGQVNGPIAIVVQPVAALRQPRAALVELVVVQLAAAPRVLREVGEPVLVVVEAVGALRRGRHVRQRVGRRRTLVAR